MTSEMGLKENSKRLVLQLQKKKNKKRHTTTDIVKGKRILKCIRLTTKYKSLLMNLKNTF